MNHSEILDHNAIINIIVFRLEGAVEFSGMEVVERERVGNSIVWNCVYKPDRQHVLTEVVIRAPSIASGLREAAKACFPAGIHLDPGDEMHLTYTLKWYYEGPNNTRLPGPTPGAAIRYVFSVAA